MDSGSTSPQEENNAPADPSAKATASAALDEVLIGTATKAVGIGAASEDYRVSIPVFEGPLDLLLHLIRKDQLNIYDIPIAQICKNYLDYIELMLEPDMNLAGEFLVMATSLMHIKSQILLPQDERAEEVEDPRLPLVAQLLEYEKFKLAAQKLDERPWLGRDVYTRPVGSAQDIMPVESLLDAPLEAIDTFQLLLCLKIAVDRTTRTPMQISVDPISIKEKVGVLTQRLHEYDIVQFGMLMPEAPRVREVIVSFLAMLELAKLKFIEIIQHENFGPIQIRGVRPLSELDAALLDTY